MHDTPVKHCGDSGIGVQECSTFVEKYLKTMPERMQAARPKEWHFFVNKAYLRLPMCYFPDEYILFFTAL